MIFHKITSGDTIIEFHNSWTGEEQVIINGQVLSKKKSVMGTHHNFTVLENGEKVRYVLTSKVNSHLQIFLDLRRNGVLTHEDIIIHFGSSKPKKPKNTSKIKGMMNLKEYELEEAITELTNAADIDPDDPEIYFHLACAYSVQEDALNGFENIKKAVENKFQNTDLILSHDLLAFLRLHIAFEEFQKSNFTKYDKKLIEKREKG